MEKKLSLLIFGLILTSCSVNRKEIIILKTLDQFETQKENEQLGIDLLNYKFPIFLQKEFPEFTQEIYKNITWQYSIQESNKQVSFRLILSNEALKYKDKIISYFEKTVNNQIDRQIKDKEIFDEAIDLTLKSFEQFENYEFDLFWENTSDILRDITNKDSLFESIKKGRKNIGEIGNHVFYCKQYYESMPSTNKNGFYVVCFIFEKDKNMFEQLTFHKEDNELKIVGYDYRTPN